MIEFENISKHYKTKVGRKQILTDACATFESGKNYAIMGPNGAGKSTLMRLLSGADKPSTGQINRDELVSWPLGFHGGFNGTMTGRENVAFVSRVYGQDPKRVLKEAEDFAEIGKSIALPVATYSSGMKQRLAFGLSLAIRFDTYLIDEVTAVGDARFKNKCAAALTDRLQASRVIMISHSITTIRKYCQSGMLLWKGALYEYEDIENLISDYKALCS